MRILALFAAGLLTAASPVFAQSTALLIGNEDYEQTNFVRRASEMTDAEGALRQSGVRVVARSNAGQDEVARALLEFGQAAGKSDTLLVGLAGKFVHSSSETYFLPVDSDTGPLATLARSALPLSTVMGWLSERPGKAVLVLGPAVNNSEISPFLAEGVGDLSDVPQGVSVVVGTPRLAARLVERVISNPGQNFMQAVQENELSVFGYAPRSHVLLQKTATPREPAPAVTTDQRTNERLQDVIAWREANSANTTDAYQRYLQQYPRGQFIDMARNRIAALTDTPEARAERTEQSLDLSRDARRDIQRDLTLLEFNTRGIDGIFGPGTRRAIGNWQSAQGVSATGYMTRDQITRLDAQAERRAAELEEQAEQRQRELLAADRAFWDETGARGDEVGIRTYLERYPDGEYSESAAERLANIERRKRRDANRVDRQFWDFATTTNTVAGYRDYLADMPNGAFRDDAEARIARLTEEDQNAQNNNRAAREEQALNLSPRTRQVIESRLERLELRPGKVDGVFDKNTRRAIRRYQRSRNLERTGYLSDAVVVQLLADSVRSIFR